MIIPTSTLRPATVSVAVTRVVVKQNTQTFEVQKNDAGTRLDVFLAVRFPDFSRAWIQKLIEKGNVRVGRRKPEKSYKLKVGENIFFTPELPPEISLEPDPTLDSKVQIVFENDDFLVIAKPAGLVVHPSSSTPKGTLVNWLLWKYPDIKTVGEDKLRPGIVHRLDKETSGLMVIAKNQKTFTWLKRQFQDRKVTKRYLALVVGEVEDESGEINWPIGRSKQDPTKQVVYKSRAAPESAREAVSYWRVIKRFPDYTYLEVVPTTGRMHQIRVHLKTIGHPVVGDLKYGDPSASSGPKHLGRMFLHASQLSFIGPTGERFSFSLPLPAELENALKNLPYML